MSQAATLLREARYAAGFTQAALAERLDVSQAAIAKLERQGSNPTVDTLDNVLRATGHRLELGAVPARRLDADESAFDESATKPTPHAGSARPAPLARLRSQA